jgi:predicted nuclease of restriction endonuclease-like (RecB) superfamily
MRKAFENGWSRNIMVMQIESKLHEREGKAQTNFKNTLPAETSDLAQQLFKNEYNLEFLGLTTDSLERHIERSLVTHIRDFLLELGTGFAFLGNQYKLDVGGDDFYIDMLFYHTRLRCYVVLELKTGKFIPEYAGKLSFYLTAVDRQLKLPDDNPTIGLLLCQDANHVVVEYALSDKKQPLSVSKYQTLRDELPKELEAALPTPEQFQHLFETIRDENNDKNEMNLTKIS